MPSLPAWYPDPDELKPAPAPLLLVQGFLNTLHLEEHSDLLRDPNTARQWLVSAGLLPDDAPLRRGDVDRAHAVRESIRTLLADDPTSTAERLGPLRALADAGRPRLTIDDGGQFGVENAQHRSLADGLFDLLLIIRRSQDDGTWDRLKACANPDCRWVFYDRSRNHQGSWCDMTVCGNRLKNRSLRARRR